MTAVASAVYAATAILCLVAAWREHSTSSAADGRPWPPFWTLLAALLAIMSVGRLLDVGGDATRFARRLARSEGWYQERRPLQAAVIAVVALVGTWAAWKAIRVVRARRPGVLLAAWAVSLLVLLTAARLVSLHWLDEVLHQRLMQRLTVADAAEMIVLALVVANAGYVSRRTSHGTPAGRAPTPPPVALERRSA